MVTTRARSVGATAVVAGVVVAALVIILGGVDGASPTSGGLATPTSTITYARAAGATTLAGTGVPGFNGDSQPAPSTELDAPSAVAEDAAGDLFIADVGNCRVREIRAQDGRSFGISMQAGHLTTIVGGSCGDSGANPPPNALAVDASGDLFIATGPGNRVEELPAHSTTAFGVSTTAGKLVDVAGTGAPGYNGDGGSASASTLDDPTGLAVDAAGDLLVADTGNCRVRMVAVADGTRFGMTMQAGHIYTVAGNGICGSAGDGGPATQAEVWDPGALAVDAQGDVLVADQGNRTIRELTAHAGTFFGVALAADNLGTVAGEGSYGPYLIDGLSAVGQVGEINFPSGLALDSKGDLYIADGDMHAIRLVPAITTSLKGQMVSADDMYTFAGALSVGVLHNRTSWIQTPMLDPTGLAMSPRGRLIYSDTGANVVRELPAAG